jgi:HSP20 family protein
MSLMIHKGNGMRTLRQEVDELFDSFFTPTIRRPESAAIWTPAVDVREDDDNFLVSAELPGMTKDDIHVEVQNNTLSIKGERKFEKKQETENYHFIERSYGSFYRSFTLPQNVNPDKIDAEYKDGILHIKLPKREEVKPKAIAVKA